MSYLGISYLDYLNESVRSPEQLLADLKRANGFTDADLAANRMGRIGEGQIPRLIQQIARPLVRSFLILAGWFLLILLVGWIISGGLHLDAQMREPTGVSFFKRFFLFRGLYIFTFVRLFAVWMIMSCAGALIIAILATGTKTIGLIGDLLAGRSAMIEGRVYATEEEGGASPWTAMREQWTRMRQERTKTYRYAIRDVAVEVSFSGFRALTSGGYYKLYYTPRSTLLLSIEPVSGLVKA